MKDAIWRWLGGGGGRLTNLTNLTKLTNLATSKRERGNAILQFKPRWNRLTSNSSPIATISSSRPNLKWAIQKLVSKNWPFWRPRSNIQLEIGDLTGWNIEISKIAGWLFQIQSWMSKNSNWKLVILPKNLACISEIERNLENSKPKS